MSIGKSNEKTESPFLSRILGTSTVFRGLESHRQQLRGLLLPKKINEHFQHGQDAMSSGEWEKAVLSFSKAINLNPQLVEAYVLRAEAYIQLCDFSSASQNLRKAIVLAPYRPQLIDRLCFVLYVQGQCLFEEESYLKALDVFTQASELQPLKSSYRFRSIACLLAMKKHQECLGIITKELKQHANPDVYILRARLYNFFLKPNQCYQDLHRALRIKPEHPEANTLLEKLLMQARKAREEAVVMALKGCLEDSLIRINCAIENSPMDPNYYLFRGTLFRRLKDFNAAIEDFLKALELCSENEETEIPLQAQRQLLLTYNDFAVLCYTKGAYEEGVLLLNKALQGEKGEKGIYINRGDCFFKLGELTFAEADYLEALALSPWDQGARYRMGMLKEKMGLRKHQMRHYHKAEEYFTSAIEYAPDKANFYFLRARSRLMLQDIFGARQDVATMLLLNPHHPQLPSMIANLFQGQSTEDVMNSKTMVMARAVLDRAIQNSIRQAPTNILGLLGKNASTEETKKRQDTPRFLVPVSTTGETGPKDKGPSISTRLEEQTLSKSNLKQASQGEKPQRSSDDSVVIGDTSTWASKTAAT
ncbi:tetratricopeptide repeat protein 16 isoform X1 [Monodelphis domestica]|uniref:tetratricopeptide repeat protein 16 isoform X1 n=2 Tax=Monodelphis domestica TaxID=13616 RepID=UPI000443493A|nr:tetratricopeptide repeat protein 16 isoform X1 [Monodelphis domestica]XP_007475098.1 tetratricopeptide repeat protein 16 isoform X1 [Monodelphis domestica]